METQRARELLARERERIEEALRIDAPEAGDDDTGDEAADLAESELEATNAEELREQLTAVERAEARVANGTFGLSIESGEPIPDGRLEVAPSAERTVAEQERFERGA